MFVNSPRPKSPDTSAHTPAPECEIDERLYRLYGLTADEIKAVEEESRRISRLLTACFSGRDHAHDQKTLEALECEDQAVETPLAIPGPTK